MPVGYDYGNARLRGMRSRLLTKNSYQSLLAITDIQELISALTTTPYKEDIESALVQVGPARCIPVALGVNFTRTLTQIPRFFEDEPLQLVNLLLQRWDRHNLLTILRGQRQEIPADTVMAALIPVGRLDRTALRELARQPGTRAAIDLMTTWQLPYARVLRQVQPRTGTIPDLDQLELALNQAHYRILLKELGQANGNRTIVREFIKTEIDLLNIYTMLRLARLPGIIPLVQQRYQADVRPLLVEPGGSLSTQRLAGLITESASVEHVVNELSDTRYGPALVAGWSRYQTQGGTFRMLERELERWQAQNTAGLFTRNPLSIGTVIAYVGCKEIEVANLRLIAQAVTLNIERDLIEPELIFMS